MIVDVLMWLFVVLFICLWIVVGGFVCGVCFFGGSGWGVGVVYVCVFGGVSCVVGFFFRFFLFLFFCLS